MTTQDEISYDVLNQVMEGLTRLNAAGVPQPAIAQSWTVSPDGRTYTFHLRAADWSDGTPVTAQDFVYAWQQALDPRNGSQESSMLAYIQGANALLNLQLPDPAKDAAGYRAAVAQIAPLESQLGLSAPNADTLVVTLAAPTPFWLPMTALPVYFPAPEADVARWGMSAYAQDPQHLLSDGPFVLSAWSPNSSIEMERNPDYWNASHVALAGIHAEIVPSDSTVANLYQAGQIDAVLPTIGSPELTEFEHQPGFVSVPQSAVEYVQFGVKTPGLNQRLVRLAFSEAVDRSGLASQVAGGGAQPAYALTPPVIDYMPGKLFTSLVGHVLPLQAAPSQARADLAGGLRAAGLSKLPALTLLCPSDAASENEAAALQAMWKSTLGIQVAIDSPDNSTYVADVESGDFQLALIGWNADYNDPTTFLDLFQGGSPDNFGGWSDAAFNSDLKAASATSGAPRGSDLAAAEKELLAQLPVIPLWWPARNYIVRPGVSGVIISPTGPDYYLGAAHLSVTVAS